MMGSEGNRREAYSRDGVSEKGLQVEEVEGTVEGERNGKNDSEGNKRRTEDNEVTGVMGEDFEGKV